MSVLSHRHFELVNGVGCCGMPIWMGMNDQWLPNGKIGTFEEFSNDEKFCDYGFCDQSAYGPIEGRPTGSPLACPKHGGPKTIMPPC